MHPYTDDDDIRWCDAVTIEILLRSFWTYDRVKRCIVRLLGRLRG